MDYGLARIFVFALAQSQAERRTHAHGDRRPRHPVACTNDADIRDRLLGALDFHEFVSRRLTGLETTLGCPDVSRPRSSMVAELATDTTPKAAASGLATAEMQKTKT